MHFLFFPSFNSSCNTVPPGSSSASHFKCISSSKAQMATLMKVISSGPEAFVLSVQVWPHRLWSSCSLVGRIVYEAWRKGADQIKSGGSLIYIGLEECVGLWVPLSHTFMIGYIGTHLWLVAQVQPGHDSETALQCMAWRNWIIHLIKQQQSLSRSHID